MLEFLHECTRALREADTADNEQPVLDRDYNEVLRGAGRRLMLRISPGSAHGLYDACLGIAALRHEGGEGQGPDHVGQRMEEGQQPFAALQQDQRLDRKRRKGGESAEQPGHEQQPQHLVRRALEPGQGETDQQAADAIDEQRAERKAVPAVVQPHA